MLRKVADSPAKKDKPEGYQGYHRPIDGVEDPELTHITRGTPCGEYMRRYWQPVAMSSELADLPKLVELLGEQLVLFRDGSGRTGLLHRHCAHRGASLEYGIVAERGLICCYHGWHFDIDGTLIRAGSEPAHSPVCNRVVQGAYPTHERNGIIFAYLGPPRKPTRLSSLRVPKIWRTLKRCHFLLLRHVTGYRFSKIRKIRFTCCICIPDQAATSSVRHRG